MMMTNSIEHPRLADLLTIACLCVLAPACEIGNKDIGTDEVGDDASEGESDETDGSEESDGSDESDTGAAFDACECIPDGPEDDLPDGPTCGEPLCDMVALYTADDDLSVFVFNPDQLDCALAALRDRTPGTLSWTMEVQSEAYAESGYLLITEDGRAIRRHWSVTSMENQEIPDVLEVSDAPLGPLAAPEFYVDCLAESDDVARFECLRMPQQVTDEICDEAWSLSEH